jgi:hypothetical protein
MFTASKHIVDYADAYAVMFTTGIALYWTLFISDTANPLMFILYLLPAGLLTVFVMWAFILSVWLLELCIGTVKKLISFSAPA